MEVKENTRSDDGVPTLSSIVQDDTNCLLYPILMRARESPDEPLLFRVAHEYYLHSALRGVGESMQVLDSSRTWLCYWVVHSLDLLGALEASHEIPEFPGRPLYRDPLLTERVSDFLGRCQNVSGGFGGGPEQMSHVAPSYSAIAALATVGTSSLGIIRRRELYSWLLSLKLEDGSFRMHIDGEIDVRATYCALACAVMCNIDTEELCEDALSWLASCQTYEGGFGGAPGREAHGGYSFCAMATAALILDARWTRRRKSVSLDVIVETDWQKFPINWKSLLRWIGLRQQSLTGGLSGRTNKLEDGCYTYWVGAIARILHTVIEPGMGYSGPGEAASHCLEWDHLREFVLCLCQNSRGGLRDKPGKPPDLYHTCYVLSGLSLISCEDGSFEQDGISEECTNFLKKNDPILNVSVERIEDTVRFFESLPRPSDGDWMSCS